MTTLFQLTNSHIKKKGLLHTLKPSIRTMKREGISGLRNNIYQIHKNASEYSPVANSDGHKRNDYQYWYEKYSTFSDEELNKQREESKKFNNKPLISIVMPVYNSNITWLTEAIDSVINQSYTNWQLCIADDCSTDIKVKEVLRQKQYADERINVVFRKKNGHISEASNSALEIAKGEWIALLDHDDLLPPEALYYVVKSINKNPNGQIFYSDEDKINEAGKVCDPYFKPSWNRTLFYSHNMINHLSIYKNELVRKVDGCRKGLEGAQDYDFALRCLEKIEDSNIIHIPRILYHWRMHPDSTAQNDIEAKSYAGIAGEKALNEHFKRTSFPAKAKLTKYNDYRIYYHSITTEPLVSIIIPTKNQYQLVKQCIDSILLKTTYSNYEIILIDNGSDDKKSLAYFKQMNQKENITVIRDDSPFNFSYLNNQAVQHHAKGEIICFLNNDTEIISVNWLTEMVSRAILPKTGAVGAMLYYPDDTIQHAGVIVGIGGVAGHVAIKQKRNSREYFGHLTIDREYSAITAACLVVKKSIFEEVGGFNEIDLAIAFNDVDLCLKIQAKDYKNIWTPHAELYHYESISRGYEDTPEKIARFNSEAEYMKNRWFKIIENDPLYNPNLTLNHSDYSYKWFDRKR